MSTLTGQLAPDFSLAASNGQNVQLSDFREKCCSVFLSERYDPWMYNRGM